MDISQIILGSIMICVGIFIVILQIKAFKNGMKDKWGYQTSFLMTGFGLIGIGIIIVVKNL
jgi:hypothetical protein